MGKYLVIKNSDFSNVSVEHITPMLNVFNIIAKPFQPNAGTVTGSGDYSSGTVVELSATPNENISFVQWNDGNNQSTRNITVSNFDETYEAKFELTNPVTYPASMDTYTGTTGVTPTQMIISIFYSLSVPICSYVNVNINIVKEGQIGIALTKHIGRGELPEIYAVKYFDVSPGINNLTWNITNYEKNVPDNVNLTIGIIGTDGIYQMSESNEGYNWDPSRIDLAPTSGWAISKCMITVK